MPAMRGCVARAFDAWRQPGVARLARFHAMPTFQEKLNEQIAYEFAASQQYIAIAVHYDARDAAAARRALLPSVARGAEPRDDDGAVPARLRRRRDDSRRRGAADLRFADDVAPVALALDQEKRVTAQISQLAVTAREEGDLVGEQFMHWFLQEQREEVSSMSALLQVVERLRDNVMLVEDYLARESGGANPLEAGAPPAAGGAL